MKTYIGTKIIQATPMNRADYNDYRAWELPANENGADEGYLVEDTNGGKANDSRHVGYISWSPNEQFEKAYIDVPDVSALQPHQARVVAEKADLDDRRDKLYAFVQTGSFDSLPRDERDLLVNQYDAMRLYSNVLARRIEAF